MYTDILKASTAISSLPMYDDLSRTWELMGTKEIKVDVELPGVLNCPVGSYIVFKGEQYTINTVPSVTKGIENGVLLYKYTITFESLLYRLYDKKFKSLARRTFQEFGNPAAYAQLVVDNINEIDPGWTVGVCDDDDPKTINFSGHTCRTALDTIAEAFGLEWDVTVKVIRFTKQVGKTTGYTFRYGQGLGLYSLSYAYQNDKNIVTRAYGYGSPRNLPEDYRAGATQLMFSEGHLDANIDLYGVKEGDYENEDIYPEVAGIISDAPAWVPGAGTFTVKDDSLTFNLNDYKSVETAKLSFTTGELQGQEFDILSFNNATKTYTLKVFQDGNSQTLPRIGYQAAPGDTYTLFDMPLPTELVTAAEVKLKAATQEWLNTNSKPQVLYSLELDPLYAREHNIMLEPGDRVTIIDAALGINELIRVSKVSYPTNFPEYITPSTKITIEIANFVPYTLTERVISDIKDTKAAVKTTISKTNYFKRMIEYVKTISGVDYLPPNTAIIDPSTGTITANLINVDFVVARNLITNKVKITAANNNIVIEDDNGDAIIIMDDDCALESYTLGHVDNGDTYLIPHYGPGFRVGLSPNNSAGFSSMSRKGNFTNGQIIAGGNGKTLVMDRDGFQVNSGKRTVSGQFDTPIDGTTQLTLRTTIENGLIVGSETLNKANLPAPTPITVNNPTTLPPDSSNDTGYVPNDGTGVVLTPAPTPTTFKEANFPMGLVTKRGQTAQQTYADILTTHVRRFTLENDLKGTTLRPTETTYNYSYADPQIIWAKANGMTVHGHCTLWAVDNYTPQYIIDYETAGTLTTDQWKDKLKSYIQAPILYYKNTPAVSGVIKSWDVVNEPFLPAANIDTTARVVFKDCVWLRVLGPQYISLAFQYAHEADPDANLFLNEYGWEFSWKKVDEMERLASEFIAAGVPMHGWGLQLHTNINLSDNSIRDNLQRMANTGMKIHISEVALSVRVGTLADPFVLTPAIEAAQAAKYVTLFNAFLTLVPVPQQFGITTWGVNDGGYWKVLASGDKDYPLLFKDDYTKHQGYQDALDEVLRLT
jgi:GH35 family endo-1,4-beta-xylanase